jgi:hypothetical protein
LNTFCSIIVPQAPLLPTPSCTISKSVDMFEVLTYTVLDFHFASLRFFRLTLSIPNFHTVGLLPNSLALTFSHRIAISVTFSASER